MQKHSFYDTLRLRQTTLAKLLLTNLLSLFLQDEHAVSFLPQTQGEVMAGAHHKVTARTHRQRPHLSVMTLGKNGHKQGRCLQGHLCCEASLLRPPLKP